MSRAFLAALVIALTLLVPASAYAWEMHISITGAGQVTETTSANLVGSGCVTSANNPTGTVGVNCYPGEPDGDYGNLWDVDYVATPKPGYSFVHWQSDGSTNPIICDRSSPPASTSTYTGSTCKFRATGNLQTRAVFEDTTNPAMSSLSGPTTAVNGATAFTFSAVADPTFTGFECRVATVHDWTSCSSGRTENPPASGSYTFEVRAVDTSGNRSGISSWGWTVDKTPPDTVFGTSIGEGSIQGPGSASFSFTPTESGEVFSCQIDSEAVESPCGSPKTYSSLGDGSHTFTLTARDSLGNVDPTPAVRHWTVDATPPDTAFTTSIAEGSTQASKSASFSFSATEAGEKFTCQLDSQAPETDCSSAKTYTNLGDGAHTFTLTARDSVGNADPTPSVRHWTIDTTPPDSSATTTIADGSFQPSNAATFNFSATEAGEKFTCQLDSQAPETDCSSAKTYTNLGDGAHTFTLTARDSLGNADATPFVRQWTVDTVAPTTTLDPAFGPAEGSTTTDTGGEFHFSSPESDVTFQCALNGGSYGSCSGPAAHTFAAQSPGPHIFNVRAVDRAGNVGPAAARSWTVAAPPPSGGSTTTNTNTSNTFTTPIAQVTPATQTTATSTPAKKKKPGKCTKLKGKKRAACVKKACKKYKRKRAKYKSCTKAVTRRARVAR
jgi:hypothetical protein